jgi:hypothetical protein
MQKGIGALSAVGVFGLLAAAANAQTPSPPTAGTQFDGKYAFVSSAKVNDTYRTPSGRMGQCQESRAGSLTVTNGQARLPLYEGTVGSQGELMLRRVPEPTKFGAFPGVEGVISGRIDKDGTAKARRTTRGCSYDVIWRKEIK